MKKRAQSEIITTVLLVLIALAAVAIIAVFIVNQVQKNTAKAESLGDCINLKLEVTKAVNNTSYVIVKRNDAESKLDAAVIKVTVDGASWGNSTVPKTLETIRINGTSNLSTNQKVEIGAILADGTACANEDNSAVTAA